SRTATESSAAPQRPRDRPDQAAGGGRSLIACMAPFALSLSECISLPIVSIVPGVPVLVAARGTGRRLSFIIPLLRRRRQRVGPKKVCRCLDRCIPRRYSASLSQFRQPEVPAPGRTADPASPAQVRPLAQDERRRLTPPAGPRIESSRLREKSE